MALDPHDLSGVGMTRLRREDGFTLPELLIALSMSLIVALAAFALIETVMKRTGEVDARVDATQHGRATMDTVTRLLRSQVCLDSTTPAMATRPPTDVTDGSDAVFYADLTGDTPAALAIKPGPDLHKLTYSVLPGQVSGQITDTVYASSWVKSGSVPVAAVASAPTSTRVIATDVIPNGNLPIFTYYGYNSNDPPAATSLLGDATYPGRALTVVELGLVSRIDVNFIALPTHGAVDARGQVPMQDEVYVRAADPNATAPTPTCA
jgi:prepilin-type N-terminal cleavage/methylation domain-containing protein